jgi:Leucine-rich repeat (LRR) protein
MKRTLLIASILSLTPTTFFGMKYQSSTKIQPYFETTAVVLTLHGYITDTLLEKMVKEIKEPEQVIGIKYLKGNTIRTSPLKIFTNLTSLCIQQNSLVNISSLESNAHLTELDLSHNDLERMPVLGKLKHLKKLNLAHNQIVFINTLKPILENLTELELEDNPIDDGELTDLKTLAKEQKLQRMYHSLVTLELNIAKKEYDHWITKEREYKFLAEQATTLKEVCEKTLARLEKELNEINTQTEEK